MHVNPNTQINFTYQPQKVFKKASLFEKAIEPLRAIIGAYVWKSLGKLNLSPDKKALLQTAKRTFISKKNVKGLTITVNEGKKTHQLDGISIGPSTGKYTVVFFGLRDCYENHLESMKKLAKDTGTTIVSINYRGTCDSTGSPDGIKDYITDGKALIEHLKQTGANPKNIVIHGHSLGGGVAAGVANEIGHPGLITSENSFSNFKLAVKDKKGAFTAWVIKKAGWNINSVKALEKIQNGQLCVIVNRRDYIIHYKNVSLHKGMGRPEVQRIKIGSKKDDDQDLQKEIKKAGWVHHLRNSHEMLMDQPKPNEVVMPDEIQKELNTSPSKQSLASQLVNLNKLYAEEDQKAYEELVKMIKTAS